MDIAGIISLLGGAALFLFGMSLMGDGLKRVAGRRLELVLYQLAGTPLKGVLLGAGVTAVIQSSSATSVMVVGFVNSGMMTLRQAAGIILSAILGTSITGWIVSLSAVGGSGLWSLVSTATITGVVAVVGMLLRMISHRDSRRRVGDILMGFAVLMFGMSAMSAAVAPLREDAAFLRVLTTFSHPALGILIGAAFTAVLQSASAAVGILQALSMTGVVTFSVALPITMGIAVGASVPVLISALGAGREARRTAFLYLLINALGAALCSLVFYTVHAIRPFPFMETTLDTFRVAALNTAFRLVTVIVLAPFTALLEKAARVVVRSGSDAAADAPELRLLEERFLLHPGIAIDTSRKVVEAMARLAKQNLLDAAGLLTDYSEAGFRRITETEAMVDRFEDRLGSYLMRLTGPELTAGQTAQVSKYLHGISDLERISDHAQNLAECAREISEKRIRFSEGAARELAVIRSAVTEILELAISSFVSGDLKTARRVEPLEELIDSLCDEMKLRHVDRLQKKICTLDQGFVFNDIITNYERVGDHCSNIAVIMLELRSHAEGAHDYLLELEKSRDGEFDRSFREFAEKYTI